MGEHSDSISAALTPAGGITRNLLLTYHHAGKKGWGSEDGETTAHNSDKLRQTLITKDKPEAIAALSAAHNFINKIASLIGDTSTIQVAKSQLSLIGRANGSGMNLFDFAAALVSLVSPPLQEIARLHSTAKHGGEHHAGLTGPRRAARG